MSGVLVRYDAMCRAIAAAYEVDEVKDIRDKAMALERYARQAKNFEAERQACEIRLRAERKVGQILHAMEKHKGGRPSETPSTTKGVSTLADLGISEGQSHRWQKLAGVSDEDFERDLAGDHPTTNGIIWAHASLGAKVDAVDPRALWLWGRLKDFERDGLLDLDPRDLFETMLPHMKETTRELAPLVAAWLREITQ